MWDKCNAETKCKFIAAFSRSIWRLERAAALVWKTKRRAPPPNAKRRHSWWNIAVIRARSSPTLSHPRVSHRTTPYSSICPPHPAGWLARAGGNIRNVLLHGLKTSHFHINGTSRIPDRILRVMLILISAQFNSINVFCHSWSTHKSLHLTLHSSHAQKVNILTVSWSLGWA